jgi:hypothetical protein
MLELARRNFNRERSEIRMKLNGVLAAIMNAEDRSKDTKCNQEIIEGRMKQILELERMQWALDWNDTKTTKEESTNVAKTQSSVQG